MFAFVVCVLIDAVRLLLWMLMLGIFFFISRTTDAFKYSFLPSHSRVSLVSRRGMKGWTISPDDSLQKLLHLTRPPWQAVR
jgi:hypothetical protein